MLAKILLITWYGELAPIKRRFLIGSRSEGCECCYMGPAADIAYELASASCFFKPLHKGKPNFSINVWSFIYSLPENNFLLSKNLFFSVMNRWEQWSVYQQSFKRATIFKHFVKSEILGSFYLSTVINFQKGTRSIFYECGPPARSITYFDQYRADTQTLRSGF